MEISLNWSEMVWNCFRIEIFGKLNTHITGSIALSLHERIGVDDHTQITSIDEQSILCGEKIF